MFSLANGNLRYASLWANAGVQHLRAPGESVGGDEKRSPNATGKTNGV